MSAIDNNLTHVKKSTYITVGSRETTYFHRGRGVNMTLVFRGVHHFYILTTASLNGGWVPETSRSFHYWQPTPR